MKTFVYTFAMSALLFACNADTNDTEQPLSSSEQPSSSSIGEQVVATEMPVMSDKVISYQRVGLPESYKYSGIVTDKEQLTSWFPNDYDEQNEECNYFAIYASMSSTFSGYLVLADDMVLYRLEQDHNFEQRCRINTDIASEAMLVCDDKDNTFANNINWNGSYEVPGWDCNDWQTIPKRDFFSK